MCRVRQRKGRARCPAMCCSPLDLTATWSRGWASRDSSCARAPCGRPSSARRACAACCRAVAGAKPSRYWLRSSCATRVNVGRARRSSSARSTRRRFHPQIRRRSRDGRVRCMRTPLKILRFQPDRVHHHFFVAGAFEHGPEPDLARRVFAVGEHQDDAAAVDLLQRVEAGGDGVVQARRIAELQLVESADQLVAIVGEAAAQLNLVVERADLRAIGRAADG